MKRAAPSPASMLRWVSYAVEPFGFKLAPHELPTPLFKGERDSLWQQPGLFNQVSERQAAQFSRYI